MPRARRVCIRSRIWQPEKHLGKFFRFLQLIHGLFVKYPISKSNKSRFTGRSI